MKKLLITIIVSLVFIINTKAQGGITLTPSVFDTSRGNSFTLKIVNQEESDVELNMQPWLFKDANNRVTPLIESDVNTEELKHITIATTKTTLKSKSTFETVITFNKELLSEQYYTGILITVSSQNSHITSNYSLSSIIFDRGDKSLERIEVSTLVKPKVVLTNSTHIQYNLANKGEYISKPTGEVKIFDKDNKLLSTIPITPEIYKDLKPSEDTKGEFGYKLPIDSLLDEVLTKYKIQVDIQSNTGQQYQTNTNIYYINPLIPAFLTFIIIAILFILISGKLKFNNKLLRIRDAN